MRMFYVLLLFLSVISAYSQVRFQDSTNGNYVFREATFTIYNYDTQQEVESRIITVKDSIVYNDVFYNNLFTIASIYNNELIACEFSDDYSYQIIDGYKLKLIEGDVEKASLMHNDNINDLEEIAPYSLEINKDVLKITSVHVYGDSRYNYMLIGKLALTMKKQN